MEGWHLPDGNQVYPNQAILRLPATKTNLVCSASVAVGCQLV